MTASIRLPLMAFFMFLRHPDWVKYPQMGMVFHRIIYQRTECIPISMAAVDKSIEELDQLEKDCCERLEALRQRYGIDRSPEVKQEYLKLLRQFADLVLHDKGQPF